MKSAEELLLSQPAVSLQIKNLENLYNTRFFDRTPRGLKVNKHGEVLYGYAKKLIESYDEMHRNILRCTQNMDSELRIAASTVPGVYFLPQILRNFKETYSSKFHFEVSETNRILEKMLNGEIDIAVVSHTIDTDGIQYEKLLRHPLFLVSPKGHLKAVNQQVSLKDLRGEDIILMKEDCDITKAWKSFLKRYHAEQEDFHITGMIDHISDIIRFLKEGVGLSILPECMIIKEMETCELERFRLKESGLYINFYLAFMLSSLKDTNIYHFYRFLKSSFRNAV